MKRLYGYLYLVGLLLSVHLLSFKSQTNYTAAEALRAVEAQFRSQLNQLEAAINHYDKEAQAFATGQSSLEALREAHLNTRLIFKKAEFLLEYNDRQSVKKYINGPPLLSLEPKVPEIRIIEPIGLQVLDELVFGDAPEEEKLQIQDLTSKLRHEFKAIKKYQANQPLHHRFIFESARLELNRIFTLGLTGFDTPGSLNALPEAGQAMLGIEQAVNVYLPLIKSRDELLAQRLEAYFTRATRYLKTNDDFDAFNRMEFLKLVINPLYADLLKAQRSLNIEEITEVEKRPSALNYDADNLFSDQLLNVQYYANLADNSQMDKRIALGKMLFYDPILSSSNERSCASCHHPDKAFTDGMDKSPALNGEGKIQRNAPTLINSVYAEHYFYDLREPQIERQISHVVKDAKEFNTDYLTIVEKLAKSETYKRLFAEAYPEYPQYQLSKWSVSNALACFVIGLRSFNSPVDQYIRGETTKISPEVERGFNLFMGKASCGTCHFAPSFSGIVPPYYMESESEVLGVPASKDTLNRTIDPDLGRIGSSVPEFEAPFYAHSFKTVTVRNIALTAPYMHNGVYDSLEEVIDFYNKGGGAGMGIEVPYQTLPDAPLNLNNQEISDLIAFMEALTDTTAMTSIPASLPVFENNPEWNARPVGGAY
jgi:cytochrome c peroxidase